MTPNNYSQVKNDPSVSKVFHAFHRHHLSGVPTSFSSILPTCTAKWHFIWTQLHVIYDVIKHQGIENLLYFLLFVSRKYNKELGDSDSRTIRLILLLLSLIHYYFSAYIASGPHKYALGEGGLVNRIGCLLLVCTLSPCSTAKGMAPQTNIWSPRPSFFFLSL